MSFMAVAVGMGASGIGATMLAGGMMGGALGGVSNLIQGKDVFSNLGQNMITGAAGAGIVSGLGAAAGGTSNLQTLPAAYGENAGLMSSPPNLMDAAGLDKTFALDSAPKYDLTSSGTTTDFFPKPNLPPAVAPNAEGWRKLATPEGGFPAIPVPAPEASFGFTQPPPQPFGTQSNLPSYMQGTPATTIETRPAAELMQNPADYMVQNPSKVAGMGMGLNSLLNPQQRGIANPIKGPGGNNYNYPYQPAQYDSSGRTIKPASYGNPAITHYAAAGGAIKHYAKGSQAAVDAANMYGDSSGKGPYNNSNPIYGSEDGPMYTDSSKYAHLAKELNKLTPTQLAAVAADDTDPIENAEAEKLLRIKTARRLGAYKPRRAAAQSDTTNMAQGGIASLGGDYAAGGKLLQGPGDGMSDSIPAVIKGARPQRAALAQGEFVVPADVVSHLGNGSTDAGAKRLYAMMDKIRHARTGNKKQGKQINPNNFLPV